MCRLYIRSLVPMLNFLIFLPVVLAVSAFPKCACLNLQASLKVVLKIDAILLQLTNDMM